MDDEFIDYIIDIEEVDDKIESLGIQSLNDAYDKIINNYIILLASFDIGESKLNF